MTMQALFGSLTALLLIIGSVPYIIDILRGRTEPERATWLIWLVLSAIAFFSQSALGAGWSLVLPAADIVVLLGIFCLSLRYGAGGLVRRDTISLLLAGLGLLVWYFTQQPLLALLIIIAIDGLGAYLTVVKTYKLPGTETLSSWIIFTLSGLSGALAVGAWSPYLLLYPAYIMAANGAVVAAILLGRRHS